MIKAVMFDLNGVFVQGDKLSDRFQRDFGVDSNEFFSALKEALTICRKPQSPNFYELMKPYFDKWNVKLTEQEFFDYFFGGEHLVTELFDYAKELKTKGLKIYVFSNNFKERTSYYLNRWPELFAIFDGMFFSWETGFVKSDIKAYENFLEKTGLKGEECVYFDDVQSNIDLAKSIGINGYIYEGIEKIKKLF
ncbi:HAD-IA family hydrolase [Candidatus Microgenomates bacterium]|nr:HAD-IA family hydrolase [Candidatus Microgenomates bacterium]